MAENDDAQTGTATGTRSFTQADVDRIVSERLQNERRETQQRITDLRAELRRAEERADQADQLQRRVDTLTKERNEARDQARTAVEHASAAQMRAEVTSVATRAGAVDADDVFRLLPQGAVTVSESGAITGAEQAVSELAEQKPHLFTPAARPAPSDGGARDEGRRDSGDGPGMNELIRRAAGKA